MTSTPLVNLQSAMQQRPDSGSAAIVLLLKFQGKSARSLGNARIMTDRTSTITNGLFGHRSILDQLKQSGRCRHILAPT